ncbi:MAG: PIN domain-containing protein [Candidatus Aminicenantes bacterium]|nr:MAG: PIN domain-containing protein [Candidatus Aminicenantes bacterium]
MSAEKILIDTSVWIEYFRNKSSPVAEKVDRILDENDVYVPKIVIAELMQGAKSTKELSIIGDFIEAFNVVDQRDDTWIKAGRLSYNLKKKGKKIHLLDCYIAVIARENGCKIFTLNRHFQDIKKVMDIFLFD